MSDVKLVPTNALAGVTVAVSVSDSADLTRLGLHAKHAEYAVAEIARAVLTAGGNLAYGGRIRPSGFTQFLMHELRRYGVHGHRLTICLAHPEHRKLSLSELKRLDETLEPSCRLRFVDLDGHAVDYRSGREETPDPSPDPDAAARAYSAMRRYMTTISHARIVVGGQLAGFKGAMPGIIEEANATLDASQPLYVAGGFGGAASTRSPNSVPQPRTTGPAFRPDSTATKPTVSPGRTGRATSRRCWRSGWPERSAPEARVRRSQTQDAGYDPHGSVRSIDHD